MFIQPYNSETVLRQVSDISIRENQPITQQPFYQSQQGLSVIPDSSVLMQNVQSSSQLLSNQQPITLEQSQTPSFAQTAYLIDTPTSSAVHPIITDSHLHVENNDYMESKRLKLTPDDTITVKRPGKKDLIKKGINRFFSSTTLSKQVFHVSEPPTLEQIENDPKRYYPFLIEILQCFGSNYFDKQGTEKGRGGEITILQKVNGVTERIASMEKQWEVDARTPEFRLLRKAWRKNLSGLWDQICSHLRSHQHLLSTDDETPSTNPTTTPNAPNDSLVDNVDFPNHSNIDDVFMNYSTKPTTQLETVDETPMGLDGFLSSSHPIQNQKPSEEMNYLTGDEVKKKSSKKKIIYPFPDDFRHYKYLPIIRIALRLNGLPQYVRQTNTLKLLKIIGEHEMSRPSFSSIKDGGLFSLPDLQMIIPPSYCLSSQGSCKSCILVNCRSNHLPTNEEDTATQSQSQMHYLLELADHQFEVITINRSSSSNTSLLCNSIQHTDCVFIHHQRSIQPAEYSFESSLKTHMENKLGSNNPVYMICSGPFLDEEQNTLITQEAITSLQLYPILANAETVNSTVLDEITNKASSCPPIEDASATLPIEWTNETTMKFRAYISQMYTSRINMNKVFISLLGSTGLSDTAACRVSRMDSTIFTVSGVYNYYLVAPYVPAITVICATDYNLPRSILTEFFSEAIQCTFLSLLPDHHAVISTYDQFILLCTNCNSSTSADLPSLDYQRLYNTLYLLCRDLAFSLAKRLLFNRKIVTVSVIGGSSNRQCQSITLRLSSDYLFRIQLGEKEPQFPWGTIQSVLVDNEIKISSVGVKVNECSIVNDGMIIEGGEKVAMEELLKKEIRIEISIGLGSCRSEAATTELNERVLKHYKNFCTSFRNGDQEPIQEDTISQEKEKTTIAYPM